MIMKKIVFSFMFALTQITFVSSVCFAADSVAEFRNNGDIQFKVINNTSAPVDYFVNGNKMTITPGESVGFSFTENTVIYKWENNKKGNTWFTVKADMHGQSYQVSDLLKKK